MWKLCVALVALTHAVCANDKFVQYVTQQYKDSINTELTKQIQKELTASYIYQSYASYFQRADVALPGVQKFFAAASLEEREHAQSLIDYVNVRGGHVEFHKIDLHEACGNIYTWAKANSNVTLKKDDNSFCICDFLTNKEIKIDGTKITCQARNDASKPWKSALMGLNDALTIERYVNQQLLDLHHAAETADDAHLSHILEHEFLDEQVTSINKLGHMVTRLNKFKGSNYQLGEYLFDNELKG